MNKLAERKTNLNKSTAYCTDGTCDLSKVPHTASATHRKYYNQPKPPKRATTASECFLPQCQSLDSHLSSSSWSPKT
jgi:hypothetical protein